MYAVTKKAIYQSSNFGNDWISTNYNFTIINKSLLFNQENQKALVIGKECSNITCTNNVCSIYLYLYVYIYYDIMNFNVYIFYF